MKQHSLILLTFAILTLFSCNRQSSDITYKIDYLYCETENDEEPGFINGNGKYTRLQTDDDVYPVVNGYGLVDGTLYKFGHDVSDTTAVIRDIELAGVMNEGLIPVCKEGA